MSEEIYVVLEWVDDDECYYADFESDGVIYPLTLAEAEERIKNLEASKEFDKAYSELHIFKLELVKPQPQNPSLSPSKILSPLSE